MIIDSIGDNKCVFTLDDRQFKDALTRFCTFSHRSGKARKRAELRECLHAMFHSDQRAIRIGNQSGGLPPYQDGQNIV